MSYTKTKLSALAEKSGAAELTDKLVTSVATLLTLSKIKTLFGLNDGYAIIPVEWGHDGATAPDAAADITSGNSANKARKFASSGTPGLKIPWIVPQDIAATPNIAFRVHAIVSEGTGMSNEAVRFSMAGYSVGHEDSVAGDAGAAQTSGVTGVTAAQYKKIVTGWSSAVAITDIAPGEEVKLLFSRDNTVGSNYGQKIAVTFIELRYAR